MAAKKDQEPSIDEILDSIRQIISEDDDDGEAGKKAAINEAVQDIAAGSGYEADESGIDVEAELEADLDHVSAEEDDEILDLTDVVKADDVGDGDVNESEDVHLSENVDLDLVDESYVDTDHEKADIVSEDSLDQADKARAFVAADDFDDVYEPIDKAVEEDLLAKQGSGRVSSVADYGDSETILSPKAEDVTAQAFSRLARRATMDRSGLISLEDIVRDEIKDILRSWVDAHMPKMLERLLQEELDKISKRAFED